MTAFQATPQTSTDVYFRNTFAFDPSRDIGLEPPLQLRELIRNFPKLKIYTPSSPHFRSLKSIWNLQYTESAPLALIRATSSSEVSTVVNHCVANQLPLTVRSGGHDLWGRSNVTDSTILDIRELNDIVLAEDKKSVTIGGGVQTGPLVDFLDSHGLVTSCTLAGIVGHVGWAFSGGFGPLVNAYGLGVDQIVGAKIVTADGNIQDADNELMWGIRGAGGAFGVLTEVKIKTYLLPRMLGGMMIFRFDQAGDVIAGLQELLETEAAPAPLSIGFHFSKREGRPVFSMAFSWASTEFDEGRRWQAKIKALGTVVMDMVTENKLTPTAVKILTSSAEKIPEGVQFGLATFLVFGDAIKPRPESSFRVREPYVFIHALGPVADENRFEESRTWTDGVLNGMRETGLVKSNYLAILAPDLSVEECFEREDLDRLKALKRKVDPGNVFKNVPLVLN